MPLSASPTFTLATAVGNIYGGTGGTSLAANTATGLQGPFYVGVSGQSGAVGTTTTGSAVGGRVQIINKSGAATAAVNGLQVTVFSTSDGTNYDTIVYGGTGFVIRTSASANTNTVQSFDLPPGQYKINFQNLDTTNAITVTATLGTIN